MRCSDAVRQTCPDLPIGNVNSEPFEAIWNNELIRRLRARLSQALFPTCTGCFHYWSHHGVSAATLVEDALARPRELPGTA